MARSSRSDSCGYLLMIKLCIAPLVLGFVVSTLVVGCGSPDDYSTTTDIDSRAPTINKALRPYFEEFVQYYGKDLAEFPMSIGPLEKGTAGKCYIPGRKSGTDQVADSVLGDSTAKQRRIVISASWYDQNKASHDAIQNVVFHELGHCVLNRGHREAKVKDQHGLEMIPESIMYPSEFGEQEYYRSNFQRYIKELFHPRAGAVTTEAGGYGSKDDSVDGDAFEDRGADEAVALY